MMSAFRVSCGTRLAPRNSKASITCPFGFTTGAASALGVSNCGRWPGWAAGAAAGADGADGGVAGGGGGGAAGGVSGFACGCAGGWPAGGCWAGAWANSAGQMEMAQKQAGITTRRRRLNNLMRAYLSTLRSYDDVETQVTVSLIQLRVQRW